MLVIGHFEWIVFLFHANFSIGWLWIGQDFAKQAWGYHVSDFFYKIYHFIVHVVWQEKFWKNDDQWPAWEVKSSNQRKFLDKSATISYWKT